MAQPRERTDEDRAVEAAIARVLDAERAARAAVEASQREAEALRADARAREKRIAERRAARLATIEAEAVGPDPQAAQDEAARSRLANAIARLADELIGRESTE